MPFVLLIPLELLVPLLPELEPLELEPLEPPEPPIPALPWFMPLEEGLSLTVPLDAALAGFISLCWAAMAAEPSRETEETTSGNTMRFKLLITPPSS
ncbi:hypothetical protein [Noviherbaspirillum galbum]|uniref:Uncharacterized protein n=1 Tax=Noviherbaspirillum galbum TaxID=2709383 RepID=A0A6B3SID0_9BURK|nr:hypothetical protein [Noviherbaspirillum galbum]NEX60420.1 hypothetical protein [Noviherbaspirillum galbum]